MEKSRLITRRNHVTVNRIRGAFGARWSHFAVQSERRARGPFSSIKSLKFGKIIFASGLRNSRTLWWLTKPGAVRLLSDGQGFSCLKGPLSGSSGLTSRVLRA